MEKEEKIPDDFRDKKTQETDPGEDDDQYTKPKAGYIPGLDCYEFQWNTDHPLRKHYCKLKKEMYSKYDCLNHENVDIKIIVDEILVMKTQLHGVGRMIRDGMGPKDLAFRVKDQQKNLRENIQLLMKYTRTEPEKKLTKTTLSKTQSLAQQFKDTMTDSERSKLASALKDVLKNRHRTDESEDPPFGDGDD